MSGFTQEQVEEMVREAVDKTEKSFGGTFKRLKAENEELQKLQETAGKDFTSAKSLLEKRVSELEQEVTARQQRISELAVRGEVQKQLRETGPLPEEFWELQSIQYTDDPEALQAQVVNALGNGRKKLARVLEDMGVAIPSEPLPKPNPTNPPSRDTRTARDLKRSSSQEVLRDMLRRGLIR